MLANEELVPVYQTMQTKDLPLSQRQNIMILKPGSSTQINYLIPFVLIILIPIKIGFVLNDYILHIKNFELYLAYYKS